MKINIANAQKETELIIKNLERGEDKLALSRLQNLRKQAYNKYYYAQRKFETEQPTGIDYQLQSAQIKQAKKELEQINASVETIRDYVKHPERFDYKTQRQKYYDVKKAFNRVNILQEKKAAEREFLRQTQKERGDVVGVTLLNIRKSDKLNALLQNVVYKNKLFNVNEPEFLRIAERIYKKTGYNILADFQAEFDTPQHYESGGSDTQSGSIYDRVRDISQKLVNIKRGYSGEDINELEQDIKRLIDMFKLDME